MINVIKIIVFLLADHQWTYASQDDGIEMAKKKFGLDIKDRNIVPITAVEDPFSIQIYAEIIC